MKSQYLIFFSMGFELMGLVMGAMYLGKMLDDKYGTRGLWVLVLLGACLISWFFHLFYLLKKIQNNSK